MPDTKITALTALTAADPANDVLPIVDVSDTTMAASGTTKKISINNVLGCSGTATLASATITGDLTVDTSTLKVDSANNRVGIVTASPADFLEVVGSGADGIRVSRSGQPTQFATLSAGATGPTLNASSAIGELSFGIAGTSAVAMTLNSTGLGVGVSPAVLLDVQSASAVIRATSSTGTNTSFAAFANTGGAVRVGAENSAGGGLFTGSSAYSAVLGTTGAYSAHIGTSGAVRMTVDSSGNVGIGVTPSAWFNNYIALELTQGAAIWGAKNIPFMNVSANVYNDGNDRYKVSSALASKYLQTAGVHSWYTAASGTAGNAITWTQAMTLDASGNLLVGVTTTGNRLDVQKSTDCTVLVKSTGANANVALDYVSTYGNHTIRKSGTAVWDFGVINDASATPAFKVSNASSVGVQLVSGATSWTTLSDETVKDIIEPISNAVSKVGSLRSVIGKFKTDDSSKRRSFLIAQDVQSVLPEAVDVVGENNELGLRYTEVIPLLVAAIKELTARVQTLETR